MSDANARDERHMRRAIELARGNPDAPFGCVIAHADTGEVVAEGLNRTADGPIWHGEIDALQLAARRKPDWRRCVLYTTAEPCPMCQAAIIWAGVSRVVFGTSVPTLARLGWDQFEMRAVDIAAAARFSVCAAEGGVLEAECDALFVRS